MNFIRRLIGYLCISFIFIVVYLYFPNINSFMDTVIENFKDSTNTLSEFIKETDLEDIKNLSNLVDNKSIKNDDEFLSEDIDFDTSYYPYYGMIDTKYQGLYKQIYENALNVNESFTPNIVIHKDNVGDIIEAVMYDHPELFWVENEYSYKYDISGNCFKIILKYNELAYNNFEENKQLFTSAADELIELVQSYSSDLKKERVVHDKLVDILQYKSNAYLNQSAYSALVNHSSVCAGYSKAFQYIMTKLGIPCYYVTGYSSGDHAWNIIYIDGYYYNVDLTWDNTGYNRYAYFNKSDSDFSKTHSRSGLSQYLPACSGSSYMIGNNSKINEIYNDIQENSEKTYESIKEGLSLQDIKKIITNIFARE